MIDVRRIGDAPIIHGGMHPSLGDNINGPSLVRVPEGLNTKLGKYYLYFSHHKGQHIRLAYADRIEGPWSIFEPGVMPLGETPFTTTVPDAPQPDWAVAQGEDGLYPHLASPDVRITASDGFEMFVHGLYQSGEQVTWRACSEDGLKWSFSGEPIPDTYLRIFEWQRTTFAMARCSRIWRRDASGWVPGEIAISPEVRHVGVLPRDDVLHVLFTRIGDAPEHILHTALRLRDDWRAMTNAAPPEPVLFPELAWEGSEQPIEVSRVGAVSFSNALRDPCLFTDDGATWLIYAGGGENALGLARIYGM